MTKYGQLKELLYSIIVLIFIFSALLLIPSPAIASTESVKVPFAGSMHYFKVVPKDLGRSQISTFPVQLNDYPLQYNNNFAWYSGDYSYRKEINVTSITNQTKYTLPLWVDYSSVQRNTLQRYAGLGASVLEGGYNSTAAWTSPTNIYTSNNAWASITATTFDNGNQTRLLVSSVYNMGVPDSSIINGIEVTVERYGANGAARDCLIQLSKDKTNRVGDNQANTSANWPSSEANVTYGNSTYLWGTTWTPADVNGRNFGLHLAAKAYADNADVYVNAIMIKIYYTNFVSTDSKSKTNFTDLFFTNSTGSALDYWIENTTSSNLALVWVELTDISSLVNNTYYMYYGYSGSPSLSNITNSFVFGDDFDDGSINSAKWDNAGEGNATETDGKLLTFGAHRYLSSKTAYGNNTELRGRGLIVNTTESYSLIGQVLTAGSYTGNLFTSPFRNYANDAVYTCISGSGTSNSVPNTVVAHAAGTTTYHTFISRRWTTSSTQRYDEFVLDDFAVTNGTAPAITNRYVYIDNDCVGQAMYVDYIFLRNYTRTEPLWQYVGLQESSGISSTPPTIATLSVGNITTTNATMNGNLTNTGGANVIYEGFVYGTTSNTTKPGSLQLPPAGYTVSYLIGPGNYTIGTFAYNATGLSSGTLYFLRAAANNTAGWGWGDEASFLTLPADPSAMSASAHPFINNLTWTKDASVNITIRYSIAGYPANYTDGSSAFLGNATSLVHSNLTAGRTYYYRGWAIVSRGGFTQYSVRYTSATATTPLAAHANAGLSLVIVGKAIPNTNYTMPLNSVEIENTGTVPIDIAIRGNDIGGGIPWTLSDTATVGNNTYGLKAGIYGGAYDVIVKKTSPYNTLISNLGVYSSQQFGLILFTPSTVSDSVTKIGSVSLVVTAH